MKHVVTIVIDREDGAVTSETRAFGGFKRDMRALVAWPPIARKPALISAASKLLNTASIAGLPSIFARRLAERLAKVPDRVRVRHALGQRQPKEAHERQPVLDQIFRSLVRRRMARLKDQNLEHQHMIVGRAATLGAVRPGNGALQIRPENLKIDDPLQPLQIVALGRKLL